MQVRRPTILLQRYDPWARARRAPRIGCDKLVAFSVPPP